MSRVTVEYDELKELEAHSMLASGGGKRLWGVIYEASEKLAQKKDDALHNFKRIMEEGDNEDGPCISDLEYLLYEVNAIFYEEQTGN